MPDSFYEPDGELYVSTELTRGPWDPGAQHAGPPAALIGREVERLGAGRIGGEGGPSAQVGRITYEVLRAVPIAPLRVEARVVRPGRRVEMFEAELTDEAGEALMRAQGWRLRTELVDFDEPEPAPEPPPGPESGEPGQFFHTGYDVGYHAAMEYRFTRGAFMERGPATVWMRMAVPLLAGEEPSPLQRVLAAADSGNGVSAALDWSRYLFINVDLSVHLHRLPKGEWVCLDAVTLPEPNGIGMADTRLLDEQGPIGRAAQTLLVADRT
ncbi:MAG TPA: thioesterase family protein [Solirubrobacterales bacterium]|nr:thioesterase family protein [Solirubrobacterales bacterium]